MYTVYILQNKKDGSYYVGQTDNLETRLYDHNRGKCKYTKNKIPWQVVHREFFDSRSEAMKRENEIKRKKSKLCIVRLINHNIG